MDLLEQRIVISYEVLTKTVKVEENDFTTFEALGILEAVKAMISNNWLNDDGE